MNADAAAVPDPAPSSPSTRRLGYAGLAVLWLVCPVATLFAPRFTSILQTLGVVLVALPILVASVRRGTQRHAFGLEDVGVLLFFCGALFATFGPQAVVDRWTCITRLAQLARFAALYYGVLEHLRRDDGTFARGAMRIGADAAFMQIAFAIVEFLAGRHDRLTSSALNPNFFASFVLAWTLVFVPGWLQRTGGRRRTVLAALVLAPLLIATGSKAGVLFFSFLVFVLLAGKTRIGFMRATGLVLVVLAAVFLVPNPLRTRILASDVNQVYPRRFYYQVGLQTFSEHPFGVGPGMNKYHFAQRAFYEPEPSFLHRRREVGLVHNVFLGAAVETGILGVLGVLLFVVAFLRRGLTRRRRASPLAIGAFAAAALLFLHAQVDGLAQSALMMSTLFFFAAIVRAQAETRASRPVGIAVPRVVVAALALPLLALLWPGIASAIEASHLDSGDAAMEAGDPRFAFVAYQRAHAAAPLDVTPVKKSLGALQGVFDATLDPMIVQRLGVEARLASQLNPLDPEPYTITAQALSDAHSRLELGGETRLAAMAEHELELALELDPLDVESRLARAHLLAFVGRDDEAIDETRRCIALERNYVQAYFYLSVLLEKQDDFDGAAAALTDAIRTHEECVDIAFESRFGPLRFFQEQIEKFDPVRAQVDVRRLKNHLHD